MNMKTLSKNQLWKLRQEVRINSLFIADFENSFGYEARNLCDFFDGYIDELAYLMENDGISDDKFFDNLFKYDNAENLYNYYNDIEYL